MATKVQPKGNKILDELAKAGKVVRKAKEDDQAYMLRVVEGVNKLSDAAFGKLSTAAQQWFNAAGEEINAKSEITAPGAEPAAAAPAKVALKGNGGVPTTRRAETEEDKEKAKAAAALDKKYPNLAEYTRQRPSSTGFQMRYQVVKNPEISFEQAAAKIGVEPVVGSHAWNEWNYTKAVMEIHKYVQAQA